MAAPFWERFVTPLAQRILALIRTPAGGGDAPDAGTFILEEPVDAVLADGRYQVGGDALRTKGHAALRAGQRVHVLWRKGARVVILTHQWQRAQGQTWQPGGGPVVEELWQVGNEVWFRNADVAASLNLARFGLVGSLGRIGWGARADRFFVQHTTATFTPGVGLVFGQRVSVFKFDRAPDRGLAPGTDPATAISLEQTYSFSDDPFVVFSYGGRNVPASTVGTGSLAGNPQLGLSIQDLAVDDAGHVIVVFGAQAGGNAPSEDIAGPGTSTSFALSYAKPVVVDVTTHTKLLDAWVDGGAGWAPIGAGDPYPTAPIPITLGDITPEGFQEVIPAIDTRQRFVLERPLVVGGALLSYIAGADRERFIAAWWTNPPAPPPAFPGFPPDPARNRAAFVQPPHGVPLVLVPPETQIFDLNYRLNETHVLWWLGGTDGNGLGTGTWPSDPAVPAALTSYELGTTASVGSAKLRFGDRNVRLLAPSFAWQPAAQPTGATTPTSEDEKDRFLALWDFDSGAVLVPATGTDVTEDAALEPAKAMADLPAGTPAQPVGPGQLEVHAINDETALGGLGRYRESAS